jgi:hypothetical protein
LVQKQNDLQFKMDILEKDRKKFNEKRGQNKSTPKVAAIFSIISEVLNVTKSVAKKVFIIEAVLMRQKTTTKEMRNSRQLLDSSALKSKIMVVSQLSSEIKARLMANMTYKSREALKTLRTHIIAMRDVLAKTKEQHILHQHGAKTQWAIFRQFAAYFKKKLKLYFSCNWMGEVSLKVSFQGDFITKRIV